MAAVVPALVGSAMGAGVAAAVGVTAGTIGMAVASSIGAMVVSSVFNDTNPFDDPAGALASIAMGAMFSQASQGIFAGQDVTVNGAAAPELVQGASAATTLSGNLYSDALSSSIGDGLSFMKDIGYDNFGEAASEIMSSGEISEFGTTMWNDSLSDQAFIRSINKNMAVSGVEPMTFDLGLDTATDMQLTNPALGGILSDTTPSTTNELAETFFSPSPTDNGTEFGLDENRLQRYQSMRNITGEPIEGELIKKEKDKKKNPFGGGMGQPSSMQMPQMPESIKTLMGSATAGSGTGGQGGFRDTQNRVVGPMIESYKRQQERMANIANQTWGIQQTSRFSGLLS